MQSEKNLPQDYPLFTKLLIAGGVVGPLLFIVVFLIKGATRPGYSAWHNSVSELRTSNHGWEQIVNFLMCGLLALGFAVGLRQVLRTGRSAVWGPILFGVFGLALVGMGVAIRLGVLTRVGVMIDVGVVVGVVVRLAMEDATAAAVAVAIVDRALGIPATRHTARAGQIWR